MQKLVLVTGGAGFIGSHTCVALIEKGFTPIILDNFSNSHKDVFSNIENITGIKLKYFCGDVRDEKLLKNIFAQYPIDAVIHFAGAKAVAESVAKPLDYYHNNVYGAISLLRAMTYANVKKIIFSSSATVYGNPASLPIKENFPRSATNAYGQSKLMIEDILDDIYRSDNIWQIIKLRYFNPAGAHETGFLGELPQGVPNNIMPYLTQVATGKLTCLNIFGDDYDTLDGTGVRDYIHVMDLAEGHVASLNYLLAEKHVPLAINLGMGIGTSVLELITAFEKVINKKIPKKIVARRSGDIPACWADATLAKKILKWQTQKSLIDICNDAWRWQKMLEKKTTHNKTSYSKKL